MSRPRRSARLFRIGLRLFPGWFRERYGEDMVANYLERAASIAVTSGRLAALLFRLRSFADVPASAIRVRLAGPDGMAADGSGATSGGWRDDLTQALRSLLRAPGWTGAALLILTLGIGGTAAVFSVLNAVLLRPLPYEDPGSLASLWTVNRVQDLPDGSSWENARDWVERSRALTDAAVVFRPEFTTATVSSFGRPERIHVGLASPNFFELLGVEAVERRVFGPADLESDARVAVIDEGLWAERYGGDPEAIGSTVTIDGEEVRILGVVPDGLTIPREETRIWRLLDVRAPQDQSYRGWDAYWVIGRLAQGATPEPAQRELDGVAAQLEVEYPETNTNRGVRVTSLRAEIVGDRLPLLLWTLFGSMVLVLAIGGTNVAQLMLSRGVERRREIAVRTSLGATRARINRQLVLESVVLSLTAGVGGLILAEAGLRGLLALIPPGVPLTERVAIDGNVLVLAFGVSAVIAPLVGLLPALATSRASTASMLREGGRGSTGSDRRLRSALVVGEVAMAVVLLAGAIGSFFIERIPDQTITLVGDPPRDPSQPAPRLTSDLVHPGFFESLGVPLVRGRALELADLDVEPPSVLVNRRWVETFARGRDPIGLRFRWGDRVEGDAMTVIGVVGDLRRTTLEEASYPQIFMAGAGGMAGMAGFAADVMIGFVGDPAEAVAGLRRVVGELDPGAAVSRVGTAWERYDVGLAPRHFQTMLFGVFAGLATLLAAIGLFAILHDAVASRRREIGIRLALGAAPAGVRAMVLRQGLGLSAAGLAVGLLAVLSLSGVMTRLVYGIESTDPLTLALVAAVLIVVAAVASVLPAVQATRVSPSETLAGE